MIDSCWREQKVEELISAAVGGISLNGEGRLAENGEPAILTLASLVTGVFRPDKHKVVSEADRQKLTVSPKRNRVLISRANTPDLVGAAVYIDADYPNVFLPDLIWQLEPADEESLSMRWFCQWLQSEIGRTELKKVASGSSASMVKISRARFFQIPIRVPPLPEQRKIADILGTWDRAIALTARLIAAKGQRKRGLMQQLLSGKTRLPDAKSWSWREIGDLFRNVKRFEQWNDEKTYIQAIVRRWSQGIELRPPLLGSQIKTKALQVIQAGDFLISDIQASYGAMSMVSTQHAGLYVSNVYSILVPRSTDSIYTPFFDQLSRTPLMNHLVVQSSNGFKAERIRLSFILSTFLKQKVYLPDDINEQRRIADILELCDEELRLLDRKLALLKQQKGGLMQQLLTGKVRVTP